MKNSVDIPLYAALGQTPVWAEFQYQFQVETPRTAMPMGRLFDGDSSKCESLPSTKFTPFQPTLTQSQ